MKTYPKVIQEKIAEKVAQIKMLARFAPTCAMLSESIQCKMMLLTDRIDFDNLSREQVLETMRVIGAGKWRKQKNSDPLMLDYITEFQGIEIRLWAAAPPQSCRIIEEEVETPAIPAGKRIVRRLICHEAPSAEPASEPTVEEQLAEVV